MLFRRRTLAPPARAGVETTFNNNLPEILRRYDRIYFKDSKSRITRANRALALKTGVKDSSELIGKSDFDFFTVHKAEIKYQRILSILGG